MKKLAVGRGVKLVERLKEAKTTSTEPPLRQDCLSGSKRPSAPQLQMRLREHGPPRRGSLKALRRIHESHLLNRTVKRLWGFIRSLAVYWGPTMRCSNSKFY